MGKRGKQPDSQVVKANRGSDHVDYDVLERELTVASLGSPFDILYFEENDLPPLMEAFLKRYLIPAAEMGILQISDTLALESLIKSYILNEEVQNEFSKLGTRVFSTEWFQAHKATLATEAALLKNLKEFGLTPKERSVITQNLSPDSKNGKEKQTKKEKYV